MKKELRKEQFLLLAECNYTFCKNIDRLESLINREPSADGHKKEIEELIGRIETEMPDILESARKMLETYKELPLFKCNLASSVKAIFKTEEETDGLNSAGILSILFLYDYLKEKENESNS